jgi:hypothetical protein
MNLGIFMGMCIMSYLFLLPKSLFKDLKAWIVKIFEFLWDVFSMLESWNSPQFLHSFHILQKS